MSQSMHLTDAQAARTEIEEACLVALNEYAQRFGVRVSSVLVERDYTDSPRGGALRCVQVDVKL